MNRRLLLIPAAGLAGALLFAAPGITAPGNKFSNESQVVHECKNSNDETIGTLTYTGPLKMWPPNHKYQPLSITAAGDDGDEQVVLGTEGWHDEAARDGSEELNGTGNTSEDVSPAADGDEGTGSATTNHEARSERAGGENGRTYSFEAQATFDGEPCIHTFTAEVPHDMRGGASWK